MKKYSILAGALLTLAAAQSHAAVIIDPGTLVGNTMGSYSGYGSTSNLSNHSYLSTNYVSGVTDYDSYIASHPTHAAGDQYSWLSSQGVQSGSLTFDLGGEFDILKLAIWNGAGGISASIRNFSVYTSNDLGFLASTLVGTFVGQQANYAATSYDLVDTTARYVRINIANNFGNSCCEAIGALAFDASTASSAVPEPASIALLGLGLAALGLRRRKAV